MPDELSWHLVFPPPVGEDCLSCVELELNGAARRARVTGAALTGLVVLNFPRLQGQPCTETSRQRQSLLKTSGLYFLKLPWFPLSFSSPAIPANPELQLRQMTWGVMHLCFVAPSSDCTGELETCWEQRCLSQFLRGAQLTSLWSAQLLWPSLKWGQCFKLLAASAAMKFKGLVTKWWGHPVFCSPRGWKDSPEQHLKGVHIGT